MQGIAGQKRGKNLVLTCRASRPWPLAVAMILLLGVAGRPLTASGASVLITFADQPPTPGGDLSDVGPMNPNVYGSAQGLPPGITATFTNFNHTDSNQDHTNNGDMKLVTATNNTSATTITFNSAVIVPSFWISPAGTGSTSSTVTGSLGGVDQFAVTNNGSRSTFKEVTVGDGKPIDTLRFTSFRGSALDDLTISTVPEPTGLAWLLGTFAAAGLRRRRATPAGQGRRAGGKSSRHPRLGSGGS